MNGPKPPFLRRGSEDEDDLHGGVGANTALLHTPQCSQSGYADEEDRHHHAMEAVAAAAAAAAANSSHHPPAPPSVTSTSSARGRAAAIAASGILSPSVHHLISEIDDNLASNFDDSLSGLGVDIASANISMSEALLALPNLSISSSQIFKQEATSPHALQTSPNTSASTSHHQQQLQQQEQQRLLKDEPHSNSSVNAPQNYGALDLSNDEAHLPDSSNSGQGGNAVQGPKNFIGSVSRENSRGATPAQLSGKGAEQHHGRRESDGDGGKANSTERKTKDGAGANNRSHRVILPLQSSSSSPQVNDF